MILRKKRGVLIFLAKHALAFGGILMVLVGCEGVASAQAKPVAPGNATAESAAIHSLMITVAKRSALADASKQPATTIPESDTRAKQRRVSSVARFRKGALRLPGGSSRYVRRG